MAASYGTGPRGKATRLHSLVVRSRGRCEKCGERAYAKLQCAHIISRKYSGTRTKEANAFCLCAKCHFYFTDHPVDFGVWTIERIGEDAYQALVELARPATKVDWDAEAARLQDVWNEIKKAQGKR